MKRFAVGLLFVAGTMLGCARNYYNIPAESFAEKVKVLGVAPIFMDADSDIIYPQKDLLIPLITEFNRKYEPLLVSKLKSNGSFYAVTPLAGDSKQLFNSLVSRREKRDDASIEYNKYFWKNDEITAYIKNNRLDALMVVVVSGLTKTTKLYSSNLLTSLETNFNFLTMTAQIIGPDGTVLWEYPNFRGHLLTYYPLVNLQYPDFSESEANLSKSTEVRFKSLDGIRRTLEQKKSDWLLRETSEPEVYGRLFDEIASLITHDGERQPKGTAVLQPAGSTEKSVPDGPASTTAPAAETPAQVPAPKKDVAPAEVPASAPDEIAPANESTR